MDVGIDRQTGKQSSKQGDIHMRMQKARCPNREVCHREACRKEVCHKGAHPFPELCRPLHIC